MQKRSKDRTIRPPLTHSIAPSWCESGVFSESENAPFLRQFAAFMLSPVPRDTKVTHGENSQAQSPGRTCRKRVHPRQGACSILFGQPHHALALGANRSIAETGQALGKRDRLANERTQGMRLDVTARRISHAHEERQLPNAATPVAERRNTDPDPRGAHSI